MPQDPRVRKVLAAYVGAGLALALATEFLTPYRTAALSGWVLLPLLALTAEFLPVTISRNGLRITFTLPFLAGMAVAVGATGALLTDILVTFAGALALSLSEFRHSRGEGLVPRPYWFDSILGFFDFRGLRRQAAAAKARSSPRTPNRAGRLQTEVHEESIGASQHSAYNEDPRSDGQNSELPQDTTQKTEDTPSQRPFWIGLNLSISAISAGCAGLLFAVVSGDGTHHTTMSALTYTGVYAIVNFLLVSQTEALVTKTRISERITATAAIAAQGMVLYCLASIAVAIFVSKDLFLLVPLILLPIIVLRQVLKLRSQMYEHYYETVTALTLMLQRAHPYTHGHLERVSRISEEVALHLGLPAARARLVREASVLHDIGKIAVDEEILDKPAKLTADEFAHVKRHSQLGAQILAPVETLRELVPWIRHHHERPDGTGYPDGLSDVEIPVESKIIAVVDAFDAMTGGDAPSDRRPYREPMTIDAALQELDRCSGTQFDPTVVQAFRTVLASGVI